MEKRYKGLSNIGATCYMNSLLQTLFMTPQFRYGIYKWKYNPKLHPKQQDSILYQLQKLFAKLQTQFPHELTTRQLVKSFQWEDQQAHMQQDIQQFNRLLFQALQKSLSSKSQKYINNINGSNPPSINFVKDYFEGQLIHYTKCLECQNQSSRQQFFQDLIITVKNIYQKVYNKNLELGFQRYLKPEMLDENNLYDCSNCGKKTKAQRGARLIKMPALLNIIFQRFTFNYFTMQRQKINDRVQFPFILNFNDYIQGYDKIPNKLNQDSSQYFKNHSNNYENNGYIKQKPAFSKHSSNSTTKSSTVVQKKSTIPSIAGKTKTKPSANTKGFLAQMRKRKNMQQQNNNQDLFYVNGNATMSTRQNNNTIETSNTQVKSQQKINAQSGSLQKLSLNQVNQNNQNNLQTQQCQIEKINNQNTIVQTINSFPLPIPPLLLLAPLNLSVPYKPSSINVTTSFTQPAQTIQSQLQRKLLQLKKLDQQKQTQLQSVKRKNKQKIQQYLKQGPLVYQLYAVLVHNGTANHGHYYCYIKSFDDQKWYCFNDQRVNVINVLQIQKTFGSGHSNAYALYYRMVDQNYAKLANNSDHFTLSSQHKSWLNIEKQEIPHYIKQSLQLQKTLILQKQKNKFDNLQNSIVLKIYYQLYVKQLEIHKSNSLQLATQKARQLFNIGEQVVTKNVRLRMFNPVTQSKLETFGGRQKQSLQDLKIGSYKNLLLQIKADNDQFEQYEVGAICLRICLIEQNRNLNSLDQKHLKLHKINIKKNLAIKQIIQFIKQKRKEILYQQYQSKQKQQQICLIKRHQNNDQTIHQILSITLNTDKSMDDLQILQNQILFVEAYSNANLFWPLQFENQIYRISIKYNNPTGSLDYHQYLTDSRLTIQALKNQLCLFLQASPDQLIMKLGTKSGRQLKDLNLTLKQARFITGTQIFFDHGIPAKSGETRIQLYLAVDSSSQTFNRLHEFQYLTDVPISGALKASQVKQKFIKVVKKLKDISLKPQQFRIRQRVSEKIGKIYRQKSMKQQQLIQKRQIAIQLKTPNQASLDAKQFSIYFRIWDQQNWTLSKKIQLIVSKTKTMKEVSQILSIDQNNKTIKQANDMCVCRILSIHKFNIIDLTQMEWFTMDQQTPVIGQPMFVNADGLLYVIKNQNQEPRLLTKQEQKKFGGTIKPAMIKNNKPKIYNPKQGKSMKIKVIQKQIQFQHQQKLNGLNYKIQSQGIQQNNHNKQEQG